jgi:hypothetical protein
MNSYAHLQREGVVPLRKAGMYLQPRAHCLLGILLTRLADAEHRHDRIPDVFFDFASMLFDNCVKPRPQGNHLVLYLLGIALR